MFATSDIQEPEVMGQGYFCQPYTAFLDHNALYGTAESKSPDHVLVKCFDMAEYDSNKWHCFRSELTVLMACNHENIPRFYGVSVEGSKYYIICSYAEGGSLFNYLYNQGLVPSAYHPYAWAQQIACGLAYIHSHGIVHRELKSPYIYLSGYPKVCKISGFGFSYVPGLPPPPVIPTAYRWTAPEQLEDYFATNQSVDIYSLGCVFSELLSGQVPLFRLREEAVPANVLIKHALPVLPAGLPSDVAAFINACLGREAITRPTVEFAYQATSAFASVLANMTIEPKRCEGAGFLNRGDIRVHGVGAEASALPKVVNAQMFPAWNGLSQRLLYFLIPSIAIEITRGDMIGQGKFGEVWEGYHGKSMWALKFPIKRRNVGVLITSDMILLMRS